MSTEHSPRIHRVINAALKTAAMGEPYGFFAEYVFAPVRDKDGIIIDLAPAWFVLVTIKSPLIGEPDLGHGFPVYGVLPTDDAFRETAVNLLALARQEASTKHAMAPISEANLRGALKSAGMDVK